MSPMLFAIPASRALVERTHAVVHRAPDASLEEMREIVVQAARLYVDSVVDGFVLSFMRDGQASRLTQALLVNLSSIIKGVVRIAIQQAAREAGQPELEAISHFFAQRIAMTVRDGEKVGLITYPLDDVQRARLERAIAAGKSGEPRLDREAYRSALAGVLEDSVARHYDDAFAVLRLGFAARHAVALGRRATLYAGHAAVRLSVAQDSADDLRALSRVLKEHLVPATMCRPA